MSNFTDKTGLLTVSDERLCFDGVDAGGLADHHRTPLFIFSESRIQENVARLRRSVAPLKVCYAAKANSLLSILRAVRDAGGDLEVNSGGELYKGLTAGFRPHQIVFNGTSKSEKEITEAVGAGIFAIQADSPAEVELISRVAIAQGKRANVSLRLVPEIAVKTKRGLQTALLTSKFGMMQEEALEICRRVATDSEHVNICGLHMHLGSQNPDAESFKLALRKLLEGVISIHEAAGHRLNHVNLGGGFPVNYLTGDTSADGLRKESREIFSAELDPVGVLDDAWKSCDDLVAAIGGPIELVVEPGRSIVADAGICITTVRNRKSRPVDTLEGDAKRDEWILTDAGFNILLSMETYKWYYEIISVDRPLAPHETPYKIAGPLCDGGDVYFDIEGIGRLPDYRNLPSEIEIGERLAILNCGAYSVSQMFPYNGRELPAVLLIRADGSTEIAKRRDSYEDLLTGEFN